MFGRAANFNQNIDAWDTGNVLNMSRMFWLATSFNQNLNTWDTSSVTNMSLMFQQAAAFNGDISAWDVSNVTTMLSMFFLASSFNQDVGGWDVGNVTDMRNMFRNTPFDQDLGSWDVNSLNFAANMFRDSTLSTPNYDSLLIGWNQIGLNSNVSFHGGNSQYCLGEAARTNMIASDNWNIIDAGLGCGGAAPTDIMYLIMRIQSILI